MKKEKIYGVLVEEKATWANMVDDGSVSEDDYLAFLTACDIMTKLLNEEFEDVESSCKTMTDRKKCKTVVNYLQIYRDEEFYMEREENTFNNKVFKLISGLINMFNRIAHEF